MGDKSGFHEKVPDEWIDRVFAVMAQAPQHTFQVLTKRPERMRAYLADEDRQDAIDDAAGSFGWCHANVRGRWPLSNVWLGVSVEDQAAADARIPLLLQTPAAVRFLSVEPLLGPVNIRGHLMSGERPAQCACGHGHGFTRCPNYGGVSPRCHYHGCACPGFQRVNGVHWVIVGGESGPSSRPCDLAWIRSVVAQCRAAGVPVFVKQLGSVPMIAAAEWRAMRPTPLFSALNRDRVPPGFIPLKFHDRKGGDPAEWPEDLRVREFPA